MNKQYLLVKFLQVLCVFGMLFYGSQLYQYEKAKTFYNGNESALNQRIDQLYQVIDRHGCVQKETFLRHADIRPAWARVVMEEASRRPNFYYNKGVGLCSFNLRAANWQPKENQQKSR